MKAAVAVKPAVATDVLPRDPDDPAIWVNRSDASRSLVLGTMKVAAPDGALAVFGLDGKLRQLAKGPDRPNNVDVEYGLELDATPTDIAVLTERLGRRLRVYAIAPDGSGVRDISAGTMPILAGAPGDRGAPMGIGLYRRPKDGAIFSGFPVGCRWSSTTRSVPGSRVQASPFGSSGATWPGVQARKWPSGYTAELAMSPS